MSMLEWAENEVKLACERERAGAPESEWDYGCACYESALKAFKSLCEDGHSGMSIGITKNILNRLIDGKPLGPIVDTDDVWEETCCEKDFVTYQCKRMSSLFKKVYSDGTIRYSDINRVLCIDINSEATYHNGFVANIINEMFPIVMPYNPPYNPYKVYREDFLVDSKNGDYDTIGVFYVIDPKGEHIDINRFFTEPSNVGSSEDVAFVEISKDEYYALKEKKDEH